MHSQPCRVHILDQKNKENWCFSRKLQGKQGHGRAKNGVDSQHTPPCFIKKRLTYIQIDFISVRSTKHLNKVNVSRFNEINVSR
jgi:hypothetical protein